MPVPLSQYWRSTVDLGDRVNFEEYLLYLVHLFDLVNIDDLLYLVHLVYLDYIEYLVYFLPLQLGWINVTRKLYSNTACSHKLCMLYQLLQ